MQTGWVSERKRKTQGGAQEKDKHAPPPKQARVNIKKYVEDARKRMKGGQASTVALKRELAAHKTRLQTLTRRHQHHERVATQTRITDMERQLKDLASGVSRELAEFDVAVQPYIDAYVHSQENHALLQDELKGLLKEPAPELTLLRVQSDMCETCEQPMVVMASEARMGCPLCSRTKSFVQATSAQIPYGEEVEFSSCSYKRKNHLQEWLNITQAKENAEVPKHVITSVMQHLRDTMRIRSSKKITRKHIRDALRNMDMITQYEHTMQIFVSITGNHAPCLEPFQEDQLRLMFDAMQAPFKKHQPEDRKNFLSYPHCLHKFCQILGYDHLLPYFPLLKGKEKKRIQDDIFKKICKELDWEFIPSGDDAGSASCSTLERFI